MRITALGFAFALLPCRAPALEPPPLLPESAVEALAGEVSGESAKRNLEFLSRHHRMRGSRGYRAAAEFIAEQLRAYGLDEVSIEQFPVDGEVFYGTQRSRPAWDADFAELWELRDDDGNWVRGERVASWEAMPITLAQDSETASVSAELVDVGAGTSPDDYDGRDVRGKLVLTSSQPGPVAALAVDQHGAVGIVSYAQNQRSAWWRENENLVRWGHLGSFRAQPTFAFMISLKRARAYQARLRDGETLRFEASVEAGRHAGTYDVVTATIRGADGPLSGDEIVYSCHLDHQRPGANDNASGSVAILEVARTLAKLVREGRLPRPRRTIRFIWPPEIEGTMALLVSRPDLAERIRTAIHLDMVGGAPTTKAIFHVTRGPASLPSFVNDVAEEFGAFVNQQSAAFAGGESVPYALISPEGGKEALLAQLVPFTMGSDHQIYAEGSFQIPVIYLNDWPDRYIHTNFDTPAHVDPTKLERAAFIAGASGYYLSALTDQAEADLWPTLEARSLARVAGTLRLASASDEEQGAALRRHRVWFERLLLDSVRGFFEPSDDWVRRSRLHVGRIEEILAPAPAPPEVATRVYRRNPDVVGPMSVFGYDYLHAHFGEDETTKLALLSHRGPRGSGREYAYEALNLVDGRRTVGAIHDALVAIYGPVGLDAVQEYLTALESIGVVESTGAGVSHSND